VKGSRVRIGGDRGKYMPSAKLVLLAKPMTMATLFAAMSQVLTAAAPERNAEAA
jgi:hypothetical protein